MRPPTLVLFTRVPQPGLAKTRLIPALGPEGAARFQWLLLERLLCELERGAGRGLWELSVHWCCPDGPGRLKGLVGEETRLVEQVDDPDLGVRMRRAIECELSLGAPAVGLMGSDLPGASEEVVAEAMGLLRAGGPEVALCPVEDGGYWFVGMSRPFPQLFEGASYGGATVFEDAVAACAAHGRPCACGPRLRDVDTPSDLAWYEQVYGSGFLASR